MTFLKQKAIDWFVPEYYDLVQRGTSLERYAHFLPKYVDKQIVQHQLQSELTTDGEIRDVCAMFIDVRGFTSFSEKATLSANNSFLNNFYDIVIYHTQEHGGIMDKFLGDGTMSLFGVFDRDPRGYVKRCVAAAHGIVEDFAQMTQQSHEPDLWLGIGISKGPAMVGSFGNGDFIGFTAIGHTVNLASRLQGLAKNNKIYITRETSEYLPADQYIPRGRFSLKNVSKPVEVFEAVATD